MVKVDPNAMSVERVEADSLYADKYFLIEESAHVKVYRKDKELDEFDAEPGDVIVYFWKDDLPHKAALLKNEVLKENILYERARRQKEKEEWAAKKAKLDEEAKDND